MRLLENLRTLRAHEAGEVQLDVNVPEIQVARDVAAPFKLILNELATNSFKYAFDNTGGILSVRVTAVGDRRTLLCIGDNGAGLSGERRACSSRTGTGLIEALARQIGGEAKWTSQDGLQLQTEFRTVSSWNRSSGRSAPKRTVGLRVHRRRWWESDLGAMQPLRQMLYGHDRL